MPNWKKVIVSGSNAHFNQVTASGQIAANASGNSLSISDTLRIAQNGSGLRMTNVGAFDNDGSDNFRIFSTNDLIFSTNGDSGNALTLDATTKDAEFFGDVSGSSTSTGSFGQIEVGGGTFTSASLAEGGVAIKDEGTTILSSAATINFTGGAVSASVDGTQTNVTIEALATEVFEFGVAVGTSIFDIELVQDSDNTTILASN